MCVECYWPLNMGDAEDHQVNVGRLTPGTSALFVCDMQVSDWKWEMWFWVSFIVQEKFRSAIYKFEDIISNTSKLGGCQQIMTKHHAPSVHSRGGHYSQDPRICNGAVSQGPRSHRVWAQDKGFKFEIVCPSILICVSESGPHSCVQNLLHHGFARDSHQAQDQASQGPRG